MEFEEIRPYHDEELPQVFEELIADPAFQQVACAVMPGVPFEAIAQKMRASKTKQEFQENLCYGILHKLAKDTTDGLILESMAVLNKQSAYTYVSNHRDIILDSGFLSVLLVEQGLDTVEIAIGDNLLIYPWIKKLVRINKCFTVQRALTMRQMLESSIRMSRYMHYTITQKKQSIWIAQREGRAKDGIDTTEQGLLKMLDMSGTADFTTNFEELNIVPLSISYEYEPCDILKARERLISRTQKYVKGSREDLISIMTGIEQQKGNIHLNIGSPLTHDEIEAASYCNKNDRYQAIRHAVDVRIIEGYKLWKTNYIGYDMVNHTFKYRDKYTPEDVAQFTDYVEHQLDKVEKSLCRADLRDIFLRIYANPVVSLENLMIERAAASRQ